MDCAVNLGDGGVDGSTGAEDASISKDGSTKEPSGGPTSLGVDPTFNNGAVVTTAMRDSVDRALYVFREPSGKVVVGGLAVSSNAMFVARFTASGAIDPTFGVEGRALVRGQPGMLAGDVVRQPDGKYIVSTNLSFNQGEGVVARLDQDGHVDATFGNAGRIVLSGMYSSGVAVHSDGTIIVSGSLVSTGPTQSYAPVLRRFLATGAVDATFGAAGTATIANTSLGDRVAFDPNGKIISIGYTASGILVGRFTSSGQPDTTFNGTGTVQTSVTRSTTVRPYREFAVQPDGKVVVGGGDAGGSPTIVRLAANGALDTTFDTDGIVSVSGVGSHPVAGLDLAPTGEIVGVTADNELYAFRLTSAGAADASFGGGKTLLGFAAYGVRATSDGIVAVGDSFGPEPTPYTFAVARLGNDGTFDTGFGTLGKTRYQCGASRDEILSIGLAADGKIVVSGHASRSGGSDADGWSLARYTPQGALDTTFGDAGRVVTRTASTHGTSALVVDTSGRSVVVGGNVACAVARFTSAGAVDTSFAGTGEQSFRFDDTRQARCRAATLDKSGRVLVAGTVATGQYSSNAFGVARLTTDGTLDTTFATTGKVWTSVGAPGGQNGAVAVAVSPAGKIVLAGGAKLTNGGAGMAAARYDATGALDTSFGGSGAVTFGDPLGYESARAVAVLDDERIVLVGGEEAYGGLGGRPDAADFWDEVIVNPINPHTAKLRVVRLTSAGAPDSSFGQNGTVTFDFGSKIVVGQAVQPLNDGRIFVAGHLLEGDTKRGFLARIMPNGTLDTTFGTNGVAVVTTGSGSGLRALALDGNGKLLLGGDAFMDGTGWDFALLRLP